MVSDREVHKFYQYIQYYSKTVIFRRVPKQTQPTLQFPRAPLKFEIKKDKRGDGCNQLHAVSEQPGLPNNRIRKQCTTFSTQEKNICNGLAIALTENIYKRKSKTI